MTQMYDDDKKPKDEKKSTEVFFSASGQLHAQQTRTAAFSTATQHLRPMIEQKDGEPNTIGGQTRYGFHTTTHLSSQEMGIRQLSDSGDVKSMISGSIESLRLTQSAKANASTTIVQESWKDQGFSNYQVEGTQKASTAFNEGFTSTQVHLLGVNGALGGGYKKVQASITLGVGKIVDYHINSGAAHLPAVTGLKDIAIPETTNAGGKVYTRVGFGLTLDEGKRHPGIAASFDQYNSAGDSLKDAGNFFSMSKKELSAFKTVYQGKSGVSVTAQLGVTHTNTEADFRTNSLMNTTNHAVDSDGHGLNASAKLTLKVPLGRK